MTICLLKEECQEVRREQFPPCNFTSSDVAGDPSVWFGVIEKKKKKSCALDQIHHWRK